MKFIGKKVKQKDNAIGREAKPDYEVVISPDGKQVEFIDNVYDPDAPSGEPNVTRIVFGKPFAVNGKIIATDGQKFTGLPEQTNKGIQPLYHAKISWYYDGDTVYLDEKSGSYVSRADAYSDVILGADISKINRKDMAYCKTLFKQLLNQNRVEQYRYTGLLVDPEQDDTGVSKKVKCGNYVGHVQKLKDGQYTKYYSGVVGEMVHDSPEMVEKRRTHYESMLRSIDRSDEEDRQAIMKLQKKISAREPKRKQVMQALNILNGKENIER